MLSAIDPRLERLARLYNVQTQYTSASGEQCFATAEALLPILRTLGAALLSLDDLDRCIATREAELAAQALPAVLPLWQSAPTEIALRLPEGQTGTIECSLAPEGGSPQRWSIELIDLPIRQLTSCGSQRMAVRSLSLPQRPEIGYHNLTVSLPDQRWECLIISAPDQAYLPPEKDRHRTWGLFLPLYALKTESNWGIGNLTDLTKFVNWVQERGGEVVATLPLLSAFLQEQPFEPSPYSPASRLFWNELYLDVTAIPEFAGSPAAQAHVASAEFQAEKTALRAEPLVDYARQAKLNRGVLERLCQELLAGSSPRKAEFLQLLESTPLLQDYAKFRAVCEAKQASWWTWPEPLRSGTITEADYSRDVYYYHAYVQWVTDSQLQQFAKAASQSGPGLYLDMPLGVNSDSYDVWRERDAFATTMSAGAPPDPFFPGGQCWGFPPLHPAQVRANNYRYLRNVLAQHMKYTGILRLDHIMGLKRAYWIPHGVSAKQGVYVEYPLHELFAILCVESQRYRTIIVGEDLGTVPPEIPIAMQQHQVHQMYVVQFMVNAREAEVLPQAPPHAYANVNTHDMPPFAAFWNALDIEDRLDLGILDPDLAREAKIDREQMRTALVRYLRKKGYLSAAAPGTRDVLLGCLRRLADGQSPLLLVNLEDLWEATDPQNVPGTWRERPNWRRKAKLSLEQVQQNAEFAAILAELDRLIRTAKPEQSRLAS